MKNFKNWYYLVIPLTKVAHANFCNIYFKHPYQCSDKFSDFWRHNYFSKNDGSYIYKLDDFTHEETYMKRKPIAFFEYLGYVDNVFLFGDAPRKWKKRFIEMQWLMEVALKEDMHVVFGE